MIFKIRLARGPVIPLPVGKKPRLLKRGFLFLQTKNDTFHFLTGNRANGQQNKALKP
jgi:hypothetical protein